MIDYSVWRGQFKRWLRRAAAGSPRWAFVLRGLKACRDAAARSSALTALLRWSLALLASLEAIWRGYHRVRRALRRRTLAGTRTTSPHELQVPRGRSVADHAFARSDRPLIHWVKGDGLDDDVTRSAVAQATRLFGDTVDYCVVVNHIDMARARRVVEWAVQPVHIWCQAPEDNPPLAEALYLAGCPAEHYGYWWKWFPARIRPHAPEWILDGDQVVVARPSWFDDWAAGYDVMRVSQESAGRDLLHGQYDRHVDRDLKLYSGLLSLPPNVDFFAPMQALLDSEPLVPPHDGRYDCSEQGCFAAAFKGKTFEPIALHEFPFAATWSPDLIFGETGRLQAPWGYHFAGSFVKANEHFARMIGSGEIYWQAHEPNAVDRVVWLRNFGQWGREGWSMQPAHVAAIDECSRALRGQRVLEIGTSRGQLAALMAGNGCLVTTVDREDRGARRNLEGLSVTVEVADAAEYLAASAAPFALVVVDLHGNDEAVWRRLWPLVSRNVAPAGLLLLYNSHLWRIPEFRAETGLRWVMDTQLAGWSVEVRDQPPPGMLICRR